MATPMHRSDAPTGETIDEGSVGRLKPPTALDTLDLQPTTGSQPGSPSRSEPDAPPSAPGTARLELSAGHVRIEIVITVSAGAPVAVSAKSTVEDVAEERAVRPWIDEDYGNRRGYDEDFLATKVPLPKVKPASVMALQHDGSAIVAYQNFSLVMHKVRRLCIYTAANLDGSPRRRRPDPTKSYTRDALAGMKAKDTEVWFTDPRLPEQFQLPDQFFTKDGGAFDRGHVVMRESLCWGDTYWNLRRANGDSYHTTNCTPQVKGFNQASKKGRWGQLENHISRRLGQERVSVFAGPILADSDWWFEGVDGSGKVRVQIPSCFWKVVVGRGQDDELVAYGFRLEQDLSAVPLSEELALDTTAWSDEFVSLEALEDEVGLLDFPKVLKRADQFLVDGNVVDELGVPRRR